MERLEYLLRETDGPKRLAQEEQARQRGEASEVLVYELLRKIVNDNVLSFTVASINRTRPGYPKVDMFVHTLERILPIQVKTSWEAGQRFSKKNPDIICIATAYSSDENLYQELVFKLELAHQHKAKKKACMT